MKRRAICTAADDESGDSSDENSMVVKPPSKKPLLKKADASDAKTAAPKERAEAKESSHEPQKKEKEFAWMDSDEEEEESKPTQAESKKEEKDEASGSEDENADVSASTMDGVETFGRMMILVPALVKKIPRMLPEDVAAACRALARTKFFDGDIIRVLNATLKRLLQRDRLSVEQTDDVLQCLWCINAYDQGVLNSIARQMKVKTASLDQAVRNSWFEIYKGFKHSDDKDFFQLLEVPHMTALNPGYRRLRCKHFTDGSCAVGEACTYAHDMAAPIELESAFIKPVSKVMMTQTQSSMGKNVYGGMRNGQIGV